MNSPRLHSLLVVLALAGAASPAAVGELLHAASSGWSDGACHEGAPCPDPDEGGDPCGPTCPCACCPGHRTAPALAVGGPAHGSLAARHFEAAPLEALHPKDVLRRVFHPPRV